MATARLTGQVALVALVALGLLATTDARRSRSRKRPVIENSCEPGGAEVCGEAGEELFSEAPMRGLHILRVLSSEDGSSTALASCPTFYLEVFVDGSKVMAAKKTLKVECSKTLSSVVKQLKKLVKQVRVESEYPAAGTVARFELDGRNGFDRWAFFTPHGESIASTAGLMRCGHSLAYEGGNFVWPGVRVGYSRTVGTDPTFGNITLSTKSLQPLVFVVEPLLTEKECEHVITIAEPNMEISPVSHIDSDVGKPSSEWRTSTQARLENERDTIVVAINKRVASVLKVPRSHQEPLQVLNYQRTQKYDAHNDFFDPEMYKNQPHMLKMVDHDGSRNRLATLLWYMNSPEEGGETCFPRSGGLESPRDFQCEGRAGEQGIKVEPVKGRAVLFYSLRPDGAIDPFSLHGGCPVKKGVKWAVNQWVWSKRYNMG